MKIYVASSWRNEHQPEVVNRLRSVGHLVYDFRRPAKGDHGFHWSEIDPHWKQWDAATYRKSLSSSMARAGFQKDISALNDSEACVLVLPCGRSSHLELGYAVGRGREGLIYLPPGEAVEPELMYRMGEICLTMDELVKRLGFERSTSLSKSNGG